MIQLMLSILYMRKKNRSIKYFLLKRDRRRRNAHYYKIIVRGENQFNII